MEKKINATEKFCTRCGKKFVPVGREVICPACKQAAAEESKKAAVLRAKKASWAGESVPARISGRASTVIREYGAANDLPFAAALDDLLKSSDYFKGTGSKWEEVEPYRSHRRDKHTTEDTRKTPQDKPQDASQDAPQEVKQAAKKAVKATSTTETTQGRQEVKQEAPQASKPQEVKQAAKTVKTVKTSKAKKVTA